MRTGLYPGTFDPVTHGHIDNIRRACRLVDRVVIGVAINRDKGPLFSLEERVAMLEAETGANCRRDGDGDRGVAVREPADRLRARRGRGGDHPRAARRGGFEYEFQMVGMNRALNSAIETVFLMADVKNQAIASKLVKEIARLGGDVSKFVPPAVAEALAVRLGRAKG